MISSVARDGDRDVHVDVGLPERVGVDVHVGFVRAVGPPRDLAENRRAASSMDQSTAASTVSTPYSAMRSVEPRAPSWAAPTCARRSPMKLGQPVVGRSA
jgi:hypothetical protein